MSVQITCKAEPSLLIIDPAGPIQFVDGIAEVDESRLAALAAYRVHGVAFPGDVEPENAVPEAEPEGKPATRKRAAKSPFGN